MQQHGGQTRAGYHPGGRWEDAREWVIASFRQHTSRDGDPELHVHNLILHKVRRETDGQSRALDSMSLYRHRPAASTIATLVMENALTRRFGVRWVPRRDGHGREIAGVSEALMWLADFLDGKDTLLMARTEDQARELSRRARDDLIRYGLVAPGPGVRLAAGEQASTGDRVMARRNARFSQPGRDERELTSRDVLQITDTASRGGRVQVRRYLGRDPATGAARWSAPFAVPERYRATYATLAYATTAHAALGRTVDTAHVLVDGLGDRQGCTSRSAAAATRTSPIA